MSRENKELIPKVDFFLDWDGTAVRNDVNSRVPVFNGAEKPGEIGLFASIKEWPEQFSGLADVHIRSLTSRPLIESSGFKIANLLGLKPRFKSTGTEFESKTGEIYFAMHYPRYGRVYVIVDEENHAFDLPCYVWMKSGDKGALYYLLKEHDYIERDLVFKPTEMDQVNALIDSSFESGLLDEKKHTKLLETIFKFAPVDRLITFSADGKQIANTNLKESDIVPAHHFTHVPKARVMKNLREETEANVIASILMDDLPDHKEHFTEEDLWINASEFKLCDFGSEELYEEVQSVIDEAENILHLVVHGFEHFKKNLLALAPLLVETFNIEEKLSSFSVDKRNSVYDNYTDTLLRHPDLADDAISSSLFLRVVMLCDDFEILSNENQIKILDDEKISFNPLDSLLEFANLSNWVVDDKYGGSRIFHKKTTPQSIIDIRIFLKKTNRNEQDYADLLDIISEQLASPVIDYFPNNLIIFLNFIQKFKTTQCLKLPGFNQAAKIIIEEFRKELGLPLPGKQEVVSSTSSSANDNSLTL